MQPEARIGFEIAIGIPSVALIVLRSWILSRSKRRRFGNTITNIALYLTLLCTVATNGSNIWASSKLIQYRDRTDVFKEPATGLPAHLVEPALKVSFALKVFYVVGLYAVKAAFLGIYVELEQHLEKRLKIAVKVITWATVLAFIGNLGLTTLWCLPFDTNWSLNPAQLCSSFRSMTVIAVGTASNVLTDLAIMAIPLFLLRTLPVRRKEMYGIAFVFTLGCICVVASIVRFVYLYNFITSNDTGLPSQQNVIVYTSELEVVIATWASCLPALRAIIRRPSRHNTGAVTSAVGPSVKRTSRLSALGEKAGLNGKHQRLTSPGDEEAGTAVSGHPSHLPQIYEREESPPPPRYSGEAGNRGQARAFGYGAYAEEGQRERRGTGLQPSKGGAYMLDDESDREGSDVELRTIPLSPRGSARPVNRQ